ncbi:MAG: SulP family inorganic anion transporter, partial [Akkermansia sp.]
MLKPILLSCLKTYNKKTFLADLFAGLTVGVVALPLAMAFAIACGLGPETGLVTAVIAGLLISLFSGSKFQIGGPTGAFVIIISGIVMKFGMDGLLTCTLMAGILLVVMGICRMGALIRFIPFPVTTGFTSGIAIVIFSTQIKDMFGLSISGEIPTSFIPKWGCYLNHFSSINWAATGLCLGTIAIIFLCKKWSSKLPSMLIGMLVMTAVAIIFHLPVETIGDRFHDLPSSLPLPSFPNLNFANIPSLMMPAFTIALLAAIESLLSASVADGMTSSRHKPNAELVAQGLGNIGSALFMGLPATGAIARTATNVKAGGKTPIAGIIHALVLLAILLAFSQYAKMIPFCVLAGILAVVCYNMSEIHVFSRLAKGPRPDALVLILTCALTVFVDLIVAVEVGVVLAALLFMGRMAQISNVCPITGKPSFEDDPEDDSRCITDKHIPAQVEIFDIQGPFFFGAVDEFKEQVINALDHDLKIVILRMRLVPALDATGLHVLDDFFHQCRDKGIKLLLCGVQEQPLDVIRHSTFYFGLKKYNICSNIDTALERATLLLEHKKKS